MRSGITHRWLRGSLFLTVLLVLLVESMFVYNFSRSYYNSVQQTMMRRFSSINGQLKMYTGDTAQKTAANRSVALRRMVEQFADKDKYEFMLLDGYGGVIASSSGTGADGIVVQDALTRRRMHRTAWVWPSTAPPAGKRSWPYAVWCPMRPRTWLPCALSPA